MQFIRLRVLLHQQAILGQLQVDLYLQELREQDTAEERVQEFHNLQSVL